MDRGIPQQFSEMSKDETLSLLRQTGMLRQTDFTAKQITAFLEQGNSRAYLGRGLYPRYYGIGQGEHSGGIDAYDPAEYPRLIFTIIGRFDKKGIVLPWMPFSSTNFRTPRFPNATDVIVLGCQRAKQKNKDVVDALLVVVLGDQPAIYTREPSAPLECPLPEPVCESYNNCR